ncbi:MAG: hypothetical protein Q9216_001898 [Gyalolechia sp. 2 TL-2023]
MAVCLQPQTPALRFSALIACSLSTFQNLAVATGPTGIQSTQTESGLSTHKTLGSPIGSVPDIFYGQYAPTVRLLAVCALLSFFALCWREKVTKTQYVNLRSPAHTIRKAVELGMGAALAKAGNTVDGNFPHRATSMPKTASCVSRNFDLALILHVYTDARSTEPGLLKKHSNLRSYTTSFGSYPAIRVFKREHPQADKLPSKPAPLPLLVFIHGLGGCLSQFHPLLTSLVNVAPCLGIDLPGCGLSDFSPTAWEAYSQRALVELLTTVIVDSCRGSDDQGIVLIGHSMGCSLGALLASSDSLLKANKINVLGLIAICPKAVPPTSQQLALFRKLISLPAPILDLWRCWDRRGGPESASVARFVGPGADTETKKIQERFNTQSKSTVWRRMAWGLYNDNRRTSVPGGRMADLETWAKLTVPMFLIAGESDKITSPDEITAIGRALGKTDRLSSESSSHAVPTLSSRSLEKHQDMDATKKLSKMGVVDEAESNTETTLLGDDGRFPAGVLNPLPKFPTKQQVLKTTILPEPAAHSLLYDPTTYRTLAGLIQRFLWDHIDSRLSLGWQLQYLSTEGKWDVKNLAKWQAVTPVSAPIAGIFRAMKTLREIDDAHCPEVFVRNWRGRLKAVVDISYETPIYDPRGLDNGGIEYHKFPTVSKIPPTAGEVQDFIKLIDRIRQTGPPTTSTQALIGVHCHYGFNRTGFFICSYLIEKEHYSVQQAIDEFQAQRPPGIRHDHFLDTLFVRRLKRAPTL